MWGELASRKTLTHSSQRWASRCLYLACILYILSSPCAIRHCTSCLGCLSLLLTASVLCTSCTITNACICNASIHVTKHNVHCNVQIRVHTLLPAKLHVHQNIAQLERATVKHRASGSHSIHSSSNITSIKLCMSPFLDVSAMHVFNKDAP